MKLLCEKKTNKNRTFDVNNQTIIVKGRRSHAKSVPWVNPAVDENHFGRVVSFGAVEIVREGNPFVQPRGREVGPVDICTLIDIEAGSQEEKDKKF